MTKLFKKFQGKLVHYAIYVIIGFILLSSALSFWNRYVTYDCLKTIDKTEINKRLTKSIMKDLVMNVELGVNAYANSGKDSKLSPYYTAVAQKDSVFSTLSGNLKMQGYDDSKLSEIQIAFDKYVSDAQQIIASVKNNDSLALAQQLTSFEFGANELYHQFEKEVFIFENEIENHAKSDFEWSITDNAIIQIILILLSVPILIIASRMLDNEVKNNQKLLSELEENNRKYLYDDGEVPVMSAESVIEKSINTFKMAFDFVESVSKGNYVHAQALMQPKVLPLNKHTLMGALLQMSGKLQVAEEEEARRQWASNGLNSFYEIVRNYQNDALGLADQSVTFLTKYLHSQQGSLFTFKKEGEKGFLELESCYAYERKKWIEKRIELGEGLVGQTFLEGEPVLLTQIPNGYTYITSGLGDATPTCLLIVPFIYNDKVEAIFEVAGFTQYETHHIEFLKKAGEFLAATLQTVKTNREMQLLLDQSQEQAENLKAQEEELRQNMEELQATNEAASRRERENHLDN